MTRPSCRSATRQIAISTDTFVVSPLEFPGGNIGSLAVHGTLNDLAMMGARPLYLTAGFVLEEGLAVRGARPDRRQPWASAARPAGVPLVTGDTKVVERGKADGLFINTTGIGLLDPGFRPAPDRARPGDVVLVSGPLGRHGMAIMAVREGLGFETTDRERLGHASSRWSTRLREALGQRCPRPARPHARRAGQCPQRDRRRVGRRHRAG